MTFSGTQSTTEGFQREFSIEDFRANMHARLRDVSIPLLHAQHKRLVEIMVLLYAEVKRLQKDAPTQESHTSLRATLDELKNYATRHFQEEEGFMQKMQFPGFAAHQEAHRVFVRSVLSLENRIWQESVSYVIDLLHLVVGWLFQHINQMDMAYARYSRGERSGLASSELHTPPALKNPGPTVDGSQKSQLAAFRDSLRARLRMTGLERIDKQHQELLNRILHFSVLTEKLSIRKPTDKDWQEIDGAMEFLFAYCRYHFKEEEGWMQKIGYPKLSIHTREHQRLLSRLKELAGKLTEERSIFFIVDLNFFLSEWFLTHTLRSDFLYVEFMSNQPLTPTPPKAG
ncbi:MAG: hemerythrin family protein [Magnetococcales bacterium]|nr:hemerythrin family protein [Magnetococcales bacterium]